MSLQRVLILTILFFFIFTCEMKQSAAFPWGCSNYSGVCRPICLPAELTFGPFGCEKGFVCCVAHIL
ncbi:beta-defensin 4 precursor [Arapaima gigas]